MFQTSCYKPLTFSGMQPAPWPNNHLGSDFPSSSLIPSLILISSLSQPRCACHHMCRSRTEFIMDTEHLTNPIHCALGMSAAMVFLESCPGSAPCHTLLKQRAALLLQEATCAKGEATRAAQPSYSTFVCTACLINMQHMAPAASTLLLPDSGTLPVSQRLCTFAFPDPCEPSAHGKLHFEQPP